MSYVGVANHRLSNNQLVEKYHHLLKVIDENMCFEIRNTKRYQAAHALKKVMDQIDKRSIAQTGQPVEWYNPTGEKIFTQKFLKQLKRTGTI